MQLRVLLNWFATMCRIQMLHQKRRLILLAELITQLLHIPLSAIEIPRGITNKCFSERLGTKVRFLGLILVCYCQVVRFLENLVKI